MASPPTRLVSSLHQMMRTNSNASGGVRKGVLEERTRIDKLENENYELKLKIRLLERKQAPAAAHAPDETGLLQENTDLKATIAALEQRLETLPARICEKYQKDVDDYFEQVRTELVAKRKLEQRVAQLETNQVFQNTPPTMNSSVPDPTIGYLTQELASVRSAKTEAESAAAALEAQLEQASLQASLREMRLQHDLEQSESQLKDVKQEILALESQLAELKTNPPPAPVNLHDTDEFKDLEAQRTAMKTENNRLEDEIKHLESCLAAAESQLRDVKRQAVDTSAADMEALEHKYQGQVRRLELELAAAREDSENKPQPHELAAAQAELSRAQVQRAELEGRTKVLENQLRGAQLQIELGENKYKNLEKRYNQKKDGDMRVLSQKVDLERQLESSKVLNIDLEDQTQALRTTLARESRARQVIEQRNSELEQVLARQREPSRVIDSNTRRQPSRVHNPSMRAPLDDPQKENSFNPAAAENGKDMAALKLRLGIDSAMEGF